MTRPSLFHRSSTRHRQRDPLELTRLRRRQARALASRPPEPPAAAVEAQIEAEPADGEAGRARAAGGPVDLATYSCDCGLIFSAPVSTTVTCPHCGCEQAW